MSYSKIAEDIGTSNGNCVLLLGPELSVNQSGIYYKSFFKELASRFEQDILRYYERENIFTFCDDTAKHCRLKEIKEFYQQVGDMTVLNLISEIKFPLIINVCPDMALERVFGDLYDYKRNENYTYLFRAAGELPDGSQNKVVPTKEKPVIYNIFGDYENNHSLVCDHSSFYDTIQHLMGEDSIPKKIQTFLKRANSFVFLGFDFDSWHYYLMCHKLGLESKTNYGSQHLSAEKRASVEIIMRDHFKFNFLEANPTEAIQSIYDACKAHEQLPQKNDSCLRTPKKNLNDYGVYISYAWENKNDELYDLIDDVVKVWKADPGDKVTLIENLLKIAGGKPPDVSTLEAVVKQNGVGLEAWYNSYTRANVKIPVNTDTEGYSREAIVEKIKEKLQKKKIRYFQDKNEMTYGDSIDSFMSRIGKGKIVLQVVSDKYLRSRYCMDEALRIKNGKDKKRVFYVMLEELPATGNADLDNLEYLSYWRSILESILLKLDTSIPDAIERGRIQMNYSIYFQIHHYVIDFIKDMKMQVNLSIPPVKNLQSYDNAINTLVTEIEKTLS